MQDILGWFLMIFPGILFLGQIISSLNFPLAQRIGLQENPDETDPLLQRAERYTAYWDLAAMGWLPLAGLLMIIDSSTWPYTAFFGAAVYFDTSGREAAKILSLKHGGISVGPDRQSRVFFSTYFIMLLISLVTLAYSLHALLK